MYLGPPFQKENQSVPVLCDWSTASALFETLLRFLIKSAILKSCPRRQWVPEIRWSDMYHFWCTFHRIDNFDIERHLSWIKDEKCLGLLSIHFGRLVSKYIWSVVLDTFWNRANCRIGRLFKTDPKYCRNKGDIESPPSYSATYNVPASLYFCNTPFRWSRPEPLQIVILDSVV